MTDVPTPLDFVDPPEHDDTYRARDIARLWTNIECGDIDACWEWLGSIASTGYGQLWVRGKNEGAHRMVCTLVHGPAPGMQALHACDNPLCCNPIHLRWGTIAENMEDRGARDRTARGTTQGRARLTEDDVRAIRRRAADGERKASLARQYGVSAQAVGFVVSRKTWRHV
jgi:hypothetical protein